MRGVDVERAVTGMIRTLTPAVTADWRVPAGDLEWSCWTTAAHVGHDLLAYAAQVAGGADDAYLPFDLAVRPDAEPAQVLRVVSACGRLLSAAVCAADPGRRAWHWGPTDPGGFAALGVNETLVHTYDITRGLGIRWRPPADLSAGVLARLFPHAPAGDPAGVLLWCTGRIALPGRPRTRSWTLRAALD